LIVPGALTGRRTGVVLPVITKKYRTVGPRVRDGLAAVAEWEAEHGPLTPAELDAARRRAGLDDARLTA
jgi:hypothetical protein